MTYWRKLLAVLNRDRVFFIDQVTAPHRLQALSAVEVSLPAHCTAIGKALLAGLTDEQVERLLPKRLPAETATQSPTVTSCSPT
jgi:DNA-binding IclR family transcriptional regulator